MYGNKVGSSYILKMVCLCIRFCFFFKQKTAYEMRIIDWSSDVCSSDLMRFVITGAASGIGRSCAELLAAGEAIAGEHQMLLADRDADNLAKTADAIGSAAATAVVDLAEPECGDRIVEAALAHMGGIDAVISDAGIIMGGAQSGLDRKRKTLEYSH